jgi:uncharacterized protein with GYD domain
MKRAGQVFLPSVSRSGARVDTLAENWEVHMARFLWVASYTAEGTKGLLKEGGTSRRDVVEKLVQGLGGKLEAFYYAFGEDDVYVIVDLPSNVDNAAASLTVAATGAVRVETVVLLTAEEIDEAAKRSVEYRPPGG